MYDQICSKTKAKCLNAKIFIVKQRVTNVYYYKKLQKRCDLVNYQKKKNKRGCYLDSTKMD